MADDNQDGTSQSPPPGEPQQPGQLQRPEQAQAHRGEQVLLDPQRLLRIAGVVREVLDEARRIHPEPGAIQHIRDVHDRIYGELREALPPELYEELDDLTPEIKDGTLEELSLAHAEILGWLEGLFQGTQLALQMQAAQAAAQAFASRERPRLATGQPDPDVPDSRYL